MMLCPKRISGRKGRKAWLTALKPSSRQCHNCSALLTRISELQKQIHDMRSRIDEA